MILSQKNFIRLSQKTNGKCFYCNKDAEVIDHFVSKNKWREWELDNVFLLKGRLDNIENLVLACSKCNSSKKDKCPEDFIGNSYKCWDRFWRANKRIGIF